MKRPGFAPGRDQSLAGSLVASDNPDDVMQHGQPPWESPHSPQASSSSLGQPMAPPARAAAPARKPAPQVGTLAPAAPSAASAPPFAAADTTNEDIQIEAINLATSFMLKSQLQNPQLLNRQNTPTELVSWGAAWKADDAVGAVKIVPAQEGMKGIDLAAAVAATDAKECKGKFLSGRTSDLVDSDVVFRGFATCEDSEGTRSSLYFIVPRKKGGFVLFSVMSSGKPDTPHASDARPEANRLSKGGPGVCHRLRVR
jgi:hypothetical protein